MQNETYGKEMSFALATMIDPHNYIKEQVAPS